MTGRARRTRAGAAVGGLLGLVLVTATALALPGALERPGRATLSVTQQGAVSGLYPGRATTVTVVVRNTSRTPVRLRGVTARPQAAPGCPAAMLRVGRMTGSKVLRPRRSTAVRLPVQLLRSAPDTCQGRTFRLALAATGTPVR